MRTLRLAFLFSSALALASAQIPKAISGGYALPNGWRLTPVGKSIATADMVLNAVAAPDGAAVIAMQAGYNPHGLVVIDTKTEEAVQRIPLKSAWFGMAWSPDGKRLYVSGGNANGDKEGYARNPTRAPIYVFDYANGRLIRAALRQARRDHRHLRAVLVRRRASSEKELLYAANRGTGFGTGNIVAFDTANGKLLGRIPVDLIPYDLVPSEDGRFLYVSNLASKSVSVIDTSAMKVIATIAVGDNPNQMVLSPDGRLFVACSNDNTVTVIDTKRAP